jgi:hypothetical protein
MKFKEDEIQETNPKVQEIFEILRDNRFDSESSRKYFITLITQLHHTNDRLVRVLFRKLGDYCTSLILQLIGNQ